MSPINFDILQADCPEYGHIWPLLRDWFHRNHRKHYIELSVLLRAMPNVGPLDLIFALEAMREREMLKISFRIRSADGDLLEGEFEEPDCIPDELWSRNASHKIPRSEGELISGFRWETADAA